MARSVALIAIALVAAALPAAAQSKRYPPRPPDPDRDEEQRSALWEAALQPDLQPYRELVRDAKRLLEQNTRESKAAAVEKLDAAIRRMPEEPDAYALRGQYFLAERDWARCAHDLGRADEYARTDPVQRTRPRLDLGVCLARAGKLADAERVLVRAAASAQGYRGELALRIGEVRIALGKLDEAIDALAAAIDGGEPGLTRMARWWLALAHDRARRPTEAKEHAALARRDDRQATSMDAPPGPWLDPRERDYLLGVAYRYVDPPEHVGTAILGAEYALLYFRRFARLAPDGPWRRRAEEHVRELNSLELPARESTGLSPRPTAAEHAQARATIRAAMPALRACLAKLPSTAFHVAITKVGRRSPEHRDRPSYRLPAPGATATARLNLEAVTGEDLDEAKRCLEAVAEKIPLPVPKELDTSRTTTFYVVAP